MTFTAKTSCILMPSSRLSGFPTTHPSFLKHRYSQDSRSLPLKINLSIPTPLPAWASLPTPPMSGTPPLEPPSDPPQLVGRRRKREDTPPPPTLRDTTQPSTTSIDISPLVEQTAQRYGDPLRAGRSIDQSTLPSPLNMPWEQSMGYGTGGGTGYSQYGPMTVVPARQQVSPRATRKTKAHVASACVNCKRKHLRCDETRPCKRCVQNGKEDTCRDVEHKKRGRPPLKPDDSSTGRMMPNLPPLHRLGESSGRSGPPTGLPPLLPTPTPSRMPYAPSYAPPTIAQSSAMAHGQFSATQRPALFPPSIYQGPTVPRCAPGMTMSTYGYAPQMQQSEGYTTSDYPNPMFPPRRPVPSQQPPNPPFSTYGNVPVQLPPILPVPPGTNVDPAIAQQQRHFQPQGQQQYAQMVSPMPSTTQPGDPSEQRDTKRPRMDIRGILGPRE